MKIAIFLMTDTQGRFCVLRSLWSEKQTLPNEWSDDQQTRLETLLTEFIRTWHWTPKEAVYLGPDRHRFTTQDGYFFLEGVRGGITPTGWIGEWVTLKEIRERLRNGSFQNPDHIDRALSLYQKYRRSMVADPC